MRFECVQDVIIIGGSVAGLSAALILGRSRRKVLVCDSGRPRNRASASMHGFLSRDGIPPAEFLEIARGQVLAYPSVSFRSGTVSEIRAKSGCFEVKLADGTQHSSRTVLLATGLIDVLPEIEGFEQFYAHSVHHCPYCDGWEHRDQAIAVLGKGKAGADFALEMLGWTKEIVFCTNGEPLDEEAKQQLQNANIRTVETAIRRLEGEGTMLAGVRFADGTFLPRSALFFLPEQTQTSDLAKRLGCDTTAEGCVECGSGVCTSVNGVFAAGNTTAGLQLAIVAAAEGAKAAWAINQALLANAQRPSEAEVCQAAQ